MKRRQRLEHAQKVSTNIFAQFKLFSVTGQHFEARDFQTEVWLRFAGWSFVKI